MPRKDRSIIKRLKRYKPKFKIGDVVLKYYQEYYVIRPDSKHVAHVTLERRFRPYACSRVVMHKNNCTNIGNSRRNMIKKGDFVRFDFNSGAPCTAFVCERNDDILTIQPLGVRKCFYVSILSNRIELVLEDLNITYTPMPDYDNDLLHAKVTCGERRAEVVDYHHLLDRYLVSSYSFHGVQRWFKREDFEVEHKVKQTIQWKKVGTLKFDYNCINSRQYPKSMINSIDMDSIKRMLWHKVRTDGQYISCNTDYDAYKLILWLENHETLFYRSVGTKYKTYHDLQFNYADLMNSNESVLPQEYFDLPNHHLLIAKQIEKTLFGTKRVRSKLQWKNDQFEVEVYIPDVMYRCCTHAEFNFLSRILWRLRKRLPEHFSEPVKKTYSLKIPLKPFQSKIVDGMVHREMNEFNPFVFETTTGHRFNCVNGYPGNNGTRGGILHLGTGLGKTVCTLALIQYRREVIRTTLIVVPLTLIDQWISELKRFTDLTYAEVHGRKDLPETMPDVIFTTYGTLLSKNRGEHKMFYMCDRVVFDESHKIKSFHSSTAVAAQCVVCKYRWCLSATPLREGPIMNISTQLRILNVKPFRQSESFLRHVVREPEERCAYTLRKIKKLIYKPLVDYAMPKVIHEEIPCKMQGVGLYKALTDIMQEKVYSMLVEGTLNRSFQKIQTFINLLHIAATDIKLLPLFMWGSPCENALTHIDEIKQSLTGNAFKENVKDTLDNIEEQTCVICLENITRPTITTCNHVFCHDCIKRSMEVKQLCPCCRAPMLPNSLKEITTEPEVNQDEDFLYMNDILGRRMKVKKCIGEWYNHDYVSEKVERLREIIQTHEKVVVFSQYNTVLEMLAKHVDSSCIITGRSTRSQRKKNLEKFKSGSNVFLLSSKVADVGINLTDANAIVFMEPSIDATSQTQAIGRIKRIGQTKDIHVYHLSTMNSIESRIIHLRKEYDRELHTLKECDYSTSTFKKYKKSLHTRYIMKILSIHS